LLSAISPVVQNQVKMTFWQLPFPVTGKPVANDEDNKTVKDRSFIKRLELEVIYAFTINASA
jgi:hypothetical protein